MLFTLFGRCHNTYNSGSKLSDQDIDKLGKHIHRVCFLEVDLLSADTDIREFMAFYRSNFPEASVLPKMHMLEAHVVPWFKQWGVGLGLMVQRASMLPLTPSTLPTRTCLTKSRDLNAFCWSTIGRFVQSSKAANLP